jgi:hypothetical protein
MVTLMCLLQMATVLPANRAFPESTAFSMAATPVVFVSHQVHFEAFEPALPPVSTRQPVTWGTGALAVVDTPRTRAIEYSDWYYKRLTIHKYASYATIPLFALQYASGQDLIKHGGEGSWGKGVHGATAASIAVLFGVNTVTGLWNLYDSRKDPNGRTRRTVHSLLMLAADAGFVWTGALAPDDDEGGSSSGASRHKTVAITSGSIALASYLMMLIWKD